MIGPREDRPTIPVLIGPFSGPVHGVSVINNALAALMSERGLAFHILDLSPGRWRRGLSYHLTRAVRTIRAGLFMLSARTGSHPQRYIMSLDGGGGLVYNIILALIARMIRRDLTFYHHSSRYVLSDSAAIRLLLRHSPKASHIFCSSKMAELFWERYGHQGSTLIINNAAWIAPPAPGQSHRKRKDPLRIFGRPYGGEGGRPGDRYPSCASGPWDRSRIGIGGYACGGSGPCLA